MAGAMRKMAVYLGLVEDGPYDGYEEYEEYDEETTNGRQDYADGRDARSGQFTRHDTLSNHGGHIASVADRVTDRASATATEPVTADLARITTLCPRTYNEARTIGEHFREGIPVILNLTEMLDSDAKRLVDFAAGLIFGLRGNIERVTNKVFLLSPANVEVTAEDKARIAEGGFFNQS